MLALWFDGNDKHIQKYLLMWRLSKSTYIFYEGCQNISSQHPLCSQAIAAVVDGHAYSAEALLPAKKTFYLILCDSHHLIYMNFYSSEMNRKLYSRRRVLSIKSKTIDSIRI